MLQNVAKCCIQKLSMGKVMKGCYCQLWRTGYLVQPWTQAANGKAPCDLTCVLGEKKKRTHGSMKGSIIANTSSHVTVTF